VRVACGYATMTQQQQPLTLCQDGVVAGSTGSTSICGKDFRERTLRSLKLSLGKLWKRRSVTITEYDPTYKVAYLGNVLTGWAKGKFLVISEVLYSNLDYFILK